MEDDDKQSKIYITSKALEQGIDIAKGFVERLVFPSAEELGLLAKDTVSLWRFKNQVRIMNKAKDICDKNNISIKAISPKILCPYLDYASLEDNDELQDKWAALLVNMVDSEQNIQNHVFPYILSQISIDEFKILDSTFSEKIRVQIETSKELSRFLSNKDNLKNMLNFDIKNLEEKMKELQPYSGQHHSAKNMIREKRKELRLLEHEESHLKRRMAAPAKIPERNIKNFELANITRLGLAKVVYEVSAGPQSIEIPLNDEDSSFTDVDFDIDIDTDTSTVITELGELFIQACKDER